MLTGGGLVTKLFLTLVTPWTVVWQAPLFMRFSREEYWSGLPFPSPGGFSPYEMLYGRLFTYINDIFLDPETQTLWSYTMAIGQFQQEIYLCILCCVLEKEMATHSSILPWRIPWIEEPGGL